MLAQIVTAATFLAALGSALMAGLYFAYSTSVMGALARMPGPQGIAAMNHINVVIMNPVFLTVFMGTAVAAALAALAAIFGVGTIRPAFVIAGAVLYIVFNIVVTMTINVPMNDALAAAGPDGANSAALWATHLDRWVFWTHIRALGCLAALAAFIVALM